MQTLQGSKRVADDEYTHAEWAYHETLCGKKVTNTVRSMSPVTCPECLGIDHLRTRYIKALQKQLTEQENK